MIKSYSRKIGSLSLALLFLAGCEGGFKSVGGDPKFLRDISGEIADGQRARGEKLYATNCQSCHGNVENSTKKGRSAAQISGAIASMSLMQSLQSLSQQDLSDIALALSPKVVVSALKYTCSAPDKRGQADHARRLTKQEIINSLAQIFGTDFLNAQAVDFNMLPDEFRANRVLEFSKAHAMSQVMAMMTIGQKIGQGVQASPAVLSKFGGSCMTGQAPNDDCVKGFVAALGKKLFRRPLSAEELSNNVALYRRADASIRTVIAVLVQSPAFLFQLETGTTTSGNKTRLSDYEIASRLSFRLTASSPDDALMAAADKGELQSMENVQKHADRLVGTAAGKAQLQNFFSDYGGLAKVPAVLSFTPGLPDTDVAALKVDMINDYRDFVEELVAKGDVNFVGLMTTEAAFPRTQRLARIYGSGTWQPGSGPVVGPSHHGILMRPALLASGGLDTNIIQRGVRIRREFLCDNLASPPADIVQSRQTETAAFTREKYSNREIVGQLTGAPSCIGCHAQINPLGYVFEEFGQFGQKRDKQIVTDSSGQVVSSHNIDSRIRDANIEVGAPESFEDAAGFVRSLAEGTKARACFAKRIFEFGRLREEASSDACALADIEKALASGKGIRTVFIENVANEDIFWKISAQ